MTEMHTAGIWDPILDNYPFHTDTCSKYWFTPRPKLFPQQLLRRVVDSFTRGIIFGTKCKKNAVPVEIFRPTNCNQAISTSKFGKHANLIVFFELSTYCHSVSFKVQQIYRDVQQLQYTTLTTYEYLDIAQ